MKKILWWLLVLSVIGVAAYFMFGCKEEPCGAAGPGGPGE